MKCEYCENEIESGKEDNCPFCGAIIKVSPINENPVVQVSGKEPELGGNIFTDEYGRLRMRCEICNMTPLWDNVKKERSCPWCHTPINMMYSCLQDADDKKTMEQEARIKNFIENFRKADVFAGIDVSPYGLVLMPGEIAYVVIDDVMLNESRSIRRSHTHKTGSSVYDYEGRSESRTHYEFQEVTRGNLFLTSKRVVFTGGQQVRLINLSEVISFDSDWKEINGIIQLSSVKRTKVMRFTKANVLWFTTVFEALRNGRFKNLLKNGPTEELVGKFVEIGLFYIPQPKLPTKTPTPSYPIGPEYNLPASNQEVADWYGCLPLLIMILLVVGVVIYCYVAI